jgi:hypothetical protein
LLNRFYRRDGSRFIANTPDTDRTGVDNK